MMTSAFAYAGQWRRKPGPFKGRCFVNGVPHPISPEGIVNIDAHAIGSVVQITYEVPGRIR